MPTLGAVLTAQAGVPAQVEAKFTMLPKLSTYMIKVAGMLPVGPDLPLPAMASTPPTLPALPDIFKGPSTVATRLQRIVIEPGKAPIGLTRYITEPAPAGGLTNTVVERRGM